MTNEKALEVLEMFLHKQCSLKRTEFAYDQITVWHAVNMATEALEASQWIPCSERLPKERERVLICLDAPINQVCISQRVDTNYWIGQGRVNVLAWMPLPKPFEVKK